MSEGTRRGRISAIVDLLDQVLPVWDLGCDHGYIGRAALERYPLAQAVFVDRARDTISKLQRSLEREIRLSGRYRLLCADILEMALPARPANFIAAGVSTNLICAFIERLIRRGGDRIICNTFQDVARFEWRVLAAGFGIEDPADKN